jgi:predicted nucleic acid-binding protein
MILDKNHIFVDTNVLNGAYLNKPSDMDCLKYLFSLQGKKLFISSLSIGQFVAFFQKKFTNEKIKDIICYLFTKFTVIEFGEQDIKKSLLYRYADLEDTIQYVIGTKMKCFFFVSNDSHFSAFRNIRALKSSEIRNVKK